MTGYESKRAAARDRMIDDDDTQVYQQAAAFIAAAFIAAEERKVGTRYGYVPKLHPSEYMDEQPAQEPVGTVQRINGITIGYLEIKQPVGTKLYTAPPQRPWVDLTDSQIEQIYYDLVKIHRGAPMPWGQIQFGKTLQALIKEKNNG